MIGIFTKFRVQEHPIGVPAPWQCLGPWDLIHRSCTSGISDNFWICSHCFKGQMVTKQAEAHSLFGAPTHWADPHLEDEALPKKRWIPYGLTQKKQSHNSTFFSHDSWPMFCWDIDHKHCASQPFFHNGMVVMRPVVHFGATSPNKLSWPKGASLFLICDCDYIDPKKDGEVPQNGLCWFTKHHWHHSSQPSTTDWVCAISPFAGRKMPAWWHVRLWVACELWGCDSGWFSNSWNPFFVEAK